MKIKMAKLMCGPKGTSRVGDIIDVEPEVAKEMVLGRFASYVDEPKPALVSEPVKEPEKVEEPAKEEVKEEIKEDEPKPVFGRKGKKK